MKKLPSILLTLLAMAAPGQAVFLDGFTYASNHEAATAWKHGPGAPAPTIQAGGGVTFSLPFSRGKDRFTWDRTVKLDLSGASSFRMELDCPAPTALRGLTIYFKSGSGYYVWGASPSRTGRQVLQISRNRCSTEGRPSGWNRIEQIRIAPWKGEAVDTRITLYALTADSDEVVVIQGTTSVQGASEKSAARHVADRISQWLGDAGIGHAMLRDEDVNDAALSSARVAILGYNYVLPTAERAALERFVRRGGKLIVCFSKDTGLARIMGLKVGDYKGAAKSGQFSAMVFHDADAWGLPPAVYQESWNIRPALPASPGCRILATWSDGAGRPSKDPAWTESPHGLWMSHILLGGDGDGKRQMLLAMVGRYLPTAWAGAARRGLAQAGRIDSYPSLEQALADLSRNARKAMHPEQVLDLLEESRRDYRTATEAYSKRRYQEAFSRCESINDRLTRAYGMIQSPKAGELRGVWDHNGVGWYAGDWDRTCRTLKAGGINAIYANWMWGGLAHYPSRVLPVSDTARLHGDQVAQAVKAARRHGLQTHLWLVCWHVKNAPEAFLKKMEKEGRLQMDASGNVHPWLNPAHPDNVDLTVRALKEAASTYALDGIHLDYIRYPGNDRCYSPYTRQRFEAWLGRKVPRWPQDAVGSGSLVSAYRRFRVDQINLFVRRVRKELKAVNPKIQLSAAVFGKYPSCVDSVGQDWMSWLKRGEVDYVCPMNYTEDLGRFTEYVRAQTRGAPRASQIMAGIGVTASESELTADHVIEQILTGRRYGVGGFVLFKLDRNLRDEILPVLSLGVTR